MQIEPLERRCLFNAGQLDATFGTAGHTQLHTGATMFAHDLDLSTQDQIVVTAEEGTNLRIWKLTRDGQVQPDFGPSGDGTFTVPITQVSNPGGQPFDPALSTAAAPDGSIFVLVGNLLYKFKSNGLRDKSFGTNGRAIIHSMAFADAGDVTVDIYGRPYVVGKDAAAHMAIIRLAINGKSDLTFATQSVLEPGGGLDETYSGRFFSARTLDDGSMIFAGTSKGTQTPGEFSTAAFDIDEVKLTLNGALARSFATHGLRVFQWASNDFDSYNLQHLTVTRSGDLAASVRDSQDLDISFQTQIYGMDETAWAPLGKLDFDSGQAVTDGAGVIITGSFNHVALPGEEIMFHNRFGDDDSAADLAAAAALTGWLPQCLEEQSDGTILTLSVPSDADTAGKGFRLDRLFRDDSPAAQLNAKTITKPQATSYKFSVQYRDDDAVSFATLGNDDITVLFPDGTTHRATLVAIDTTSNAKSITATYRVAAPVGGWTNARNGTYNVKINKRTVRDINGNPTGPRTIGAFQAQIN